MSTELKKRELREALKVAVDKEHRFGLRDDCRADLDRNWDLVIEKLLELVKRGRAH